MKYVDDALSTQGPLNAKKKIKILTLNHHHSDYNQNNLWVINDDVFWNYTYIIASGL